ncbi:hypothetical protein N7537_008132 [Penicillium hordei]|uniref:Uncharacterized protein n=1 Tax=Penicillium hordei TaxID=40994 RepID=A0AAD6E128_9EURO|nr:uncharacterized protein N7537_008132 [Penicillium hordei]KAJ5598048.1 hypothetical protein N7537_008132 [Penicillium hordei]
MSFRFCFKLSSFCFPIDNHIGATVGEVDDNGEEPVEFALYWDLIRDCFDGSRQPSTGFDNIAETNSSHNDPVKVE